MSEISDKINIFKELLERLAIEESKTDFWQYRKYINKNLKTGWWQKEIARELQQFYEDFVAGKKPKLIIQAPPQHGKSTQVIDFISWLAGKHPDVKTIYTSFSERLGVRANLKLQRIFTGEKHKKIFPNFEIGIDSLKNKEILEFSGCEGYFRNTTVRGSITGESLDLGVIDDPTKGREEAGSITIRDKTWEWFTDDLFTRFSEEAALLCIATSWHVDDVVQRMIKNLPDVKVLKYPAIAVVDDEFRKTGDVLFPELKSLNFMLERKKVLGTSNFEALYQQNPLIIGGEIIKGQWFARVEKTPKIIYRKIFGDTAQKTGERNDYSVLECWGYGEDRKIYLLDLIRGKWEAPELKRKAVDFWNKHLSTIDLGALREMVIEDKASGTGLIQELRRDARIPIRGVQRNTDKLTRVLDALPTIEAGYV